MQKWKEGLVTLVIGAVTISPFVANVAYAGAEKKTVKGDKPADPAAAEIETGQMLDKGPRWKPSVSAQSPSGGDTPVDAPAVDVEQGQLLDKGPRWKPSVSAQGQTGGDTPVDAPASEIEQGQKLDKPPYKPPTAAAADNDLCGVPYTPPCRSDASTVKKAADKAKPGLKGGSVIVALLASASAIGLLVATSGGDDNPTSP